MIGERISHYRILATLGGGGMGVVYRAEDERLGRLVAIKFLPPDLVRDDRAKARFVQEARAASALDHPNICTVYEIDETPDGHLFLVMACYEGETLRARIARGPLRVADAVGIAGQIAAGLAKAHGRGIVHRDIKPANVMLTSDGVAKILDFGLARLPEAAVTETGALWGTVGYMSPEQATGGAVDHRTDLWSLGVILYEMLAGERPFPGDTAPVVLFSILHATAAPLRKRREDVPAELDRVVARALSRSPWQRFDSADEMAAELGAIGIEPGSADSRSSPMTSGGTRRLPSIAVLPFADLSPERDQEYFCEGMAEELINALSVLQGVLVPSRTSSFQFKGTAADISEIGGRLRVDTVLEGSVRKAGSRLRITVQLVNVSDGFRLWSGRYDRELDDVFAVQEEIARAVVETLRVKLIERGETPLVRRATGDLEAYTHYLQGRHHWTWRRPGFIARALDCFERAIAMDPDYALAHTGIADCHLLIAHYWVRPAAEARPKATAAAERALELDPTLPEAHHSLGAVRFFFDWDAGAAEWAWSRALELNPRAALTNAYYTQLLCVQPGRFAEADDHARRAVKLDPVSTVVSYLTAARFFFNGEPDRALDAFDRSLELDRDSPQLVWGRALALSALGRHDEAVESAKRMASLGGGQVYFTSYLGTVLAAAGRADEAKAVIGDLTDRRSREHVAALAFANVLAPLGDTAAALQAVEQAVQERTCSLQMYLSLPHFARLRAHERFERALAAVGVKPQV